MYLFMCQTYQQYKFTLEYTVFENGSYSNKYECSTDQELQRMQRATDVTRAR